MNPAPIAALLHEAAEIHHRVYRITQGEDPDWASWYAHWLVDLSELPVELGRTPVKSELTYLLVLADKEYSKLETDEPWEQYYARMIIEHFRD
jgi:hypothetical protein